MATLTVIPRSAVGKREPQFEWDGEGPAPVLLTREPNRTEPISHCGGCNARLMLGVESDELRRLKVVLLCPVCGAYNEAQLQE